MALTAGVLSLVNVTNQTVSLSSTAASGGTGPYTEAWYASTTTGFSPGAGNIIAGSSGLALVTSGLAAGTLYYFKVVYTDTGNANATVTSTQLAVTTQSAQSQNQFAQSPILGTVDMPYATNTHPVVIDATQVTPLFAGAAVKIVANTAQGVPSVVGCAANSDNVYGFLNYNSRNQTFTAGFGAEVSLKDNVVWLYATAAVTQGVQLQLDLTANGGVLTSAGSSGANYVGWAYDGIAAAGPIRVYLATPSYKTF